MREVVVDTDMGVDDALAVMYLDAREDVSIKAFTTVAGNAPESRVVRNVNYLQEKLGLEVPVYRGSREPLKKTRKDASSQGEVGLGDISPGPEYEVSSGDAITGLPDLLDGDTELLALGPFTNIARVVEQTPQALDECRRMVCMGGAIDVDGNITQDAEFNFWTDPEAVNKLLSSSIRPVIVPLDVCRMITIDIAEGFFNPSWIGDMLRPYQSYYCGKGFDGAVMYDPTAAALLSDRSKGRYIDLGLSVGTGSENRGRCERSVGKNVRVCLRLESKQIKSDIIDILKNLAGETATPSLGKETLKEV